MAGGGCVTQAGDARHPSPVRVIDEAVEQAAPGWVLLDDALIERTERRAREAQRGRARVLLHPGPDDALHEMLIVLPQDSCDVPHINFRSAKSFHVLRGEVVVLRFSDDGREAMPIRLTANVSASAAANVGARMLRLGEACWHTLIPLTPQVAFIETIVGPFTGNRFAPWSPLPDAGARWQDFAASLRAIAHSGSSGSPRL